MSLADLGLLYCAAVWGATFYMVKDALAGVSAETLVGYRFLLSAALLIPFVLRRPRIWVLVKESSILALLLFLLYVSQTVGLKYTSASNSGFITGLFVIFVPLFLLVFFRKPPTTAHWFASAVALLGLWILTGGVGAFNKGDALTLIAAVTYAGHLLATDVYVKGDADAVLLSFHQFWMTGVASLLYGAAVGTSFSVRTNAAWGAIAFLAVFPTLTAFFVQMVAQRKVSAIKCALIFSLEPVFAAMFAWTVGGETFVASRAIGGALIVAAMIAGELSKLDLLKGRRKEVIPA